MRNGHIQANERRHLTARRKCKIASFLHLCDLARAYPDNVTAELRAEFWRVVADARGMQAV